MISARENNVMYRGSPLHKKDNRNHTLLPDFRIISFPLLFLQMELKSTKEEAKTDHHNPTCRRILTFKAVKSEPLVQEVKEETLDLTVTEEEGKADDNEKWAMQLLLEDTNQKKREQKPTLVREKKGKGKTDNAQFPE